MAKKKMKKAYPIKKSVNKSRAADYYDLTRMDHSFLVVIAILIGEIIVLGGFPLNFRLVGLSLLTGIFIQMGSFAIGDYYDVRTDIKNRRFDRPIARGSIKPKHAFHAAWLLFAAGLLCSVFINETAVAIAIAFTVIGILYGYYLKKLALIGNAATALSMAIPFIFGNYVFRTELSDAIIALAAIAFFLGMGREIVKGIQDYRGDKATGRKTLAILISPEKAKYFSIMFILVAVALSLYPILYVAQYYADYAYSIFILMTDFILLSTIYPIYRLKRMNEIRAWTLMAQFTGIIGFLLGAIM